MNVLLRPVRSSVGNKYVMAITGLMLVGFVLGHMTGNLLIYQGKVALNEYAHALQSRPHLLWTARIGLLTIFLIHIGMGLWTWQRDAAARPVRYVYERTIQASWSSRHMLMTGLVILAFVIYHLLHFTLGVVDSENFAGTRAPEAGYRDVAGMVADSFSRWPIVLSYLVAQLILGLHLWHGGSSWLQHLGLSRRGYDRLVGALGKILAVVVVVGNCSIPLTIWLGLYYPR
jgi:succinate dehydrogenase / fumarate reductase cytochrome b subunit